MMINGIKQNKKTHKHTDLIKFFFHFFLALKPIDVNTN